MPPEGVLLQDGLAEGIGLFHCPMETIQEPGQPLGDIEAAFLGAFEHCVVFLALLTNFGRHGVEALRTVFEFREAQFRDGPGDPSIAIIEWMNGDKIEMRQSRPDESGNLILRVEPGQKDFHFTFYSSGQRRFEMDFFISFPAGNNLHFSLPPRAGADLANTEISRRKKNRMTEKKYFSSQGLGVVFCGVHHYPDDALHVLVRRCDLGDRNSQATRKRGTHTFG